MPLELQLIRASEFICLNADGHVDLATSQMMLTKIARACRKRGIERAMVDLRKLHPVARPRLTQRDLVALVNTFHSLGFSKEHRLALLYSFDPHGRARLFAWITSMHGSQVRCFTSFEEAMFWISDEQTADNGLEIQKPLPSNEPRSHSFCKKIRL